MDFKRAQPLLAVCMVMLFGVSQLSASPEVITGEETSQLEADQQLFEKAVALSLQQEWEKAEPIYRDILSRHDSWPEPRNNLAVLLFNTNRIDEARTLLEQAVVTQPSFRISQRNRTQLYNYLASQAYNRALGADEQGKRPDMELIQKVYLPVKVVEKRVEVIVEKPVEVEVASASPQLPVEQLTDSQADTSGLDDGLADQLNGWALAWSEGDVDRYLGNYSPDFLPDDGRKSFQEWKNIRRARLRFSKNVKVTLDQFRLFLEPGGHHALVEFQQSYRSSSYSDRVLKQLYLQKNQDEKGTNKWLILAERVIKTY